MDEFSRGGILREKRKNVKKLGIEYFWGKQNWKRNAKC
jgi:hypothetical protein